MCFKTSVFQDSSSQLTPQDPGYEVQEGYEVQGISSRLKSLIEQGHKAIFVESSRAISRSAAVTEDFYKMASNNNVDIITNDLSNLFKLDAIPAEAFMRRIMAPRGPPGSQNQEHPVHPKR